MSGVQLRSLSCVKASYAYFLAQAFYEFDEDGDGALSAEEVRSLTTTIGLVRATNTRIRRLHKAVLSCPPSSDFHAATIQGWTAKDVMTVIDVDKKQLKRNAVMPIDFLQFIDAVVEVHGDPFYELRYRCARLKHYMSGVCC